jgi:glycosyltransferase involved in cell wall biosynthesis
MEKVPISVIVLTYNEGKNIEDCLKSVSAWADEVFVLDSYSTDGTLEIARRYTDNIFEREFVNYSEQRNWALRNLPVRNSWVINMDADERATPELAIELGEKLSDPDFDADGLLISLRTFFMGKWIRHGGFYPAYHARIFRKEKGMSEERVYDQHFLVDGKLVTLENDLTNIITTDLAPWIDRLNKYTSLEAQEIIQPSEGRQVIAKFRGNPMERKRWLRKNYYKSPLFLRAFAYYFYRYFLRMGFLDGVEGMIFHLIQGFWVRFLVDVKVFEMRRRNGQKNTG